MSLPPDEEMITLGRLIWSRAMKNTFKQRCKKCFCTEDLTDGRDICQSCCTHERAKYTADDYEPGEFHCIECAKQVNYEDYDLVRRVQDGRTNG